MTLITLVLLISGLGNAPDPTPAALFERGTTYTAFVAGATAQRALWTTLTASANVPEPLVSRLRRVGQGLRVVVVAEDWCLDSVNTLPFVARLAAKAGVELRIVNRQSGRSLLDAHPTRDGRVATPLILLLRETGDEAWIERPAPLQQLFLAIASSPAAARVVSSRQRWYDNDRGRTALEEIVTLAEQQHARP
ncbi:MAG: thioredoxin family protein [Vicinamibacterales bacterium]